MISESTLNFGIGVRVTFCHNMSSVPEGGWERFYGVLFCHRYIVETRDIVLLLEYMPWRS